VSATAKEIPLQNGATPPRWQADLALAFVALIWGTTFVVVKAALAEISTVLFLAIRFSVAALFMALLFSRSFRLTPRAQVWAGLRGGATAGIFLWTGYMLQTYGLKYTAAGKSGFLTGLYIVLVPLISAVVYRRMPQLSEVTGILLATAGMVLLAAPTLQWRMNAGDLLTIGCAVAFAFHLLVLGYHSQREQFEAVALGQIASAAVLSALSLLAEPPRVLWSAKVVFALLLTSVFATALAFALQTWGQQFTSASRAALIFALEPVFSLVTAVTLGGEEFTRLSVLGGGLILGGILLVELKPLRRR
jgi:drug/metabolite transporter (DMT)-like permease